MEIPLRPVKISIYTLLSPEIGKPSIWRLRYFAGMVKRKLRVLSVRMREAILRASFLFESHSYGRNRSRSCLA